tara:strand:+ start:65 stop:409 length:345 start_codon:yes stop_codon:yes gene_type:complete
MAIYSNLIVDQGSSFTATINVEDSSGNIVNVNGYALAGRIKKNYESLTSVEFDVTSPIVTTDGSITIALTDTKTKAMEPGRYVYDVEIISSGGITTRVLEGQVEVTPGVTLAGS